MILKPKLKLLDSGEYAASIHYDPDPGGSKAALGLSGPTKHPTEKAGRDMLKGKLATSVNGKPENTIEVGGTNYGHDVQKAVDAVPVETP